MRLVVNSFLILFLLLGCGAEAYSPNIPLVFRPHSSVPKVKYSMFEKAIDIWNEAVGEEVVRFDPSVTDNGINGYDGTNTFVWKELDKGSAGMAYWLIDCDIQIDPRIAVDEVNEYAIEEPLLTVILHEIGHCLTLGHSENRQDLMYKDTNGSKKPSFKNIEDVKEFFGLPKPGGGSGS